MAIQEYVHASSPEEAMRKVNKLNADCIEVSELGGNSGIYRVERLYRAPSNRVDWPRPIPVSERLPENDDGILIYMDNPDDEPLWGSGWYERGNFFFDGDSHLRLKHPPDNSPAKNVTHWLPMPPKPE